MWSMPTTAVMGKDLCRRTERWLTKPLLLAGAVPFCEGALLLLSTSAAAMHSAIQKAAVSAAGTSGNSPFLIEHWSALQIYVPMLADCLTPEHVSRCSSLCTANPWKADRQDDKYLFCIVRGPINTPF